MTDMKKPFSFLQPATQSYADLKKSETLGKAKGAHPDEGSDDAYEEHAGHFDQAHEDYRGHGIQTVQHPKTGTFMAEAHDLRHPNAEMGEGLKWVSKPHSEPGAAVESLHGIIDHHLDREFAPPKGRAPKAKTK